VYEIDHSVRRRHRGDAAKARARRLTRQPKRLGEYCCAARGCQRPASHVSQARTRDCMRVRQRPYGGGGPAFVSNHLSPSCSSDARAGYVGSEGARTHPPGAYRVIAAARRSHAGVMASQSSVFRVSSRSAAAEKTWHCHTTWRHPLHRVSAVVSGRAWKAGARAASRADAGGGVAAGGDAYLGKRRAGWSSWRSISGRDITACGGRPVRALFCRFDTAALLLGVRACSPGAALYAPRLGADMSLDGPPLTWSRRFHEQGGSGRAGSGTIDAVCGGFRAALVIIAWTRFNTKAISASGDSEHGRDRRARLVGRFLEQTGSVRARSMPAIAVVRSRARMRLPERGRPAGRPMQSNLWEVNALLDQHSCGKGQRREGGAPSGMTNAALGGSRHN